MFYSINVCINKIIKETDVKIQHLLLKMNSFYQNCTNPLLHEHFVKNAVFIEKPPVAMKLLKMFEY
jgi:hypothetical protein